MGTHAVHGDSTAVESGVAPLAEPMFSVELLEDDFLEDITLDESNLEPPPKVSKVEPSIKTSDPSSSLKPKSTEAPPSARFKTGIETAKEMRGALVKDIKQIHTKIDNMEKKIEIIEKQNNDLLQKVDLLINLFRTDV
ncbi:uncharacterized protein LOC129912722 [Episyrphus balteatus]|uniref:uncharacterized protein LOC129912722 n=1 Tax=Episyrphus balteatus TaxID=286459 RepID=UPI0024862CDC|nr:uncharacterized protein LOC129912722 [Episyrphus balteatus]